MAQWQPSKYTRGQLEERRLEALKAIQAGGKTNQQIADQFGVSLNTIYTWKERFRDRGSLEATPTPGRPSRLSSAQFGQISTLLKEGAGAHGFPDETWTTPRICDLIGRHFGIWYHPDHLRKLLHRLGFSPQRPSKGAVEQDEQLVRTWVQIKRPELEKKGRAGRDFGVSR